MGFLFEGAREMGTKTLFTILVFTLAILFAQVMPAHTMPTNEDIEIVTGDVNIQFGDSDMTVNVSSPKAIINLDNFK